MSWAPDFSTPHGEPAWLAPDSVQWRIYKNPIALGVGGVAAVLLEFAEPRIRTGVWEHSTYKTDPIGRTRRTGEVALLSCYGAKSQAEARSLAATKSQAEAKSGRSEESGRIEHSGRREKSGSGE